MLTIRLSWTPSWPLVLGRQWSAAERAVVGHLVKSDTSPTRPGGCGGNPDPINSSVVLVKWSGTRWSSNHPPIDAVALSCTSRIWFDNQTSHSAWPSSLRHQSVSSHLHHSDTSTIFWITLHYRTCGMQVLSINKFSIKTLLSHPKTSPQNSHPNFTHYLGPQNEYSSICNQLQLVNLFWRTFVTRK